MKKGGAHNMKNKVVISTKAGERFELSFRPFAKEVVVTCLETAIKLDFISPIRILMKSMEAPLVEEGIYSDIIYKCHSKKEFKKMVEELKTK